MEVALSSGVRKLLGALTVLGLMATLLIPADWNLLTKLISPVVAAAVLFVVIYYRWKEWRSRVDKYYGRSERGPAPDKTDWIDRLNNIMERAAHADLSIEQRTVFTYMLLYRADSRRRIVEHIDLRDDIVRRTCTVESATRPIGTFGSRSNSSEASYYVPVMNPIKGRLINSLQVTDSAGSTLPTLTYEESLVVLAAVGRDLYARTFGANADIRKWSKRESVGFLKFLNVLISAKGHSFELGRRAVRAQTSDAFFAFAGRKGMKVADRDAASDLTLLIKQVRLNYVIISMVPAGERVLITHSYRVDRNSSYRILNGSRRQNVSAWLRRLAGLVPTTLQVPVHRAKTCGSYHLNVQAPLGTYIDRALLNDGRKTMPKSNLVGYVLDRPHFRTAGEGSTELHFYARAHRHISKPLFLNIRVLERPPGTLGRATVVASAVGALIIATALFAPKIDGSTTSLQIDVVAGVTAMLTVASLIWLFIFGKGGASLFAIGSAVMSIALLLVGMLMMISSVAWDWKSNVIVPGISVFAMLDWRWSLPVLAISLLVVSTFVNFFLRLLQYRWVVARNRSYVDIQDSVTQTVGQVSR